MDKKRRGKRQKGVQQESRLEGTLWYKKWRKTGGEGKGNYILTSRQQPQDTATMKRINCTGVTQSFCSSHKRVAKEEFWEKDPETGFPASSRGLTAVVPVDLPQRTRRTRQEFPGKARRKNTKKKGAETKKNPFGASVFNFVACNARRQKKLEKRPAQRGTQTTQCE